MNPSYLRIKLDQQTSFRRIKSLLDLEDYCFLKNINTDETITLSCNSDGDWLGAALLIYEVDSWTFFSDLTGYLSSLSNNQWVALSKNTEVIFAGYNDAVPYGQLKIISNSEIVRDFLEDLQDPSENINIGKSQLEKDKTYAHWMDIVEFVDKEITSEPDTADLWILKI